MATQHDFTQGPIARQLFYFSGPIILANLLQVSYQLIDSLWVGNLIGANALAAVSLSGTVLFTVLSFVIGLNNAALTILSQQKGRGSGEGLRRYLNAFVVLLSGMSIGLGIIGFILAEQLLRLVGTPEEILPMATVYLKINFIGMLFLFGYNFIGTALRSVGDSKSPLYFVAIAVVLNTVLDPLFISVFGWGVEGAAYATIVSQGSAFFKRVTRYGFFYNLAVMLIIAAILYIFAEPAVRLFLKEEDAVEFGTEYLRGVAFFYPFLGINFILNGTVRAAGAMFQVLVLNILSFWVLRYPLTYLFAQWYGQDGIALGIGVSFVISSIFAFLYYRYGKWREIKAISED